MQAEFWHERWQQGRTGFHEGQPNDMLVRHFGALALGPGARVFVPLCGKTRDIAWFLARGHTVAGAELSEIAIVALFSELGVAPEVTVEGPLKHFRAAGIDIHVGDIFDLTPAAIGPVDAVYDRAALVALPPEMRVRYAARLIALTGGAPQMLNCFEYDQNLMDGPPFSVTAEEVRRLYGGQYQITMVDSGDLSGGVRGQPARDVLWLLA